ncbi:hypothetical protein [Roseomonas chloroacetimidivorans]|uniref:hypothetical protein n=1 Tax=Roseomonas chloroacetimidivorans TaxID=1766656 RepID=UPI003C764BB0
MGLYDLALQHFDGPGVYNNLLASGIWAIFGLAALFLIWISRRVFRIFRISAFWRITSANTSIVVLLFILIGTLHTLPMFVIAAAAAIFASWFMLRGYTTLGVVDAYSTTEAGIGFAASLDMANGPIDFLGIGGDKLTSLPSFEATMRRCAINGSKVRFLLSPPSNPQLESQAKRNGVNPTAYSDKVRESLRRIAQVKISYNLAIEVRFYSVRDPIDRQLFRLMFINEDICLWGWTVWGQHAGRHNPQVVLTNHVKGGSTNTAYNAFHDYFENIWADSEASSVNLHMYK